MTIRNTGFPVVLLFCAVILYSFAVCMAMKRFAAWKRLLCVLPAACAVLFSRCGYALLQFDEMNSDFRWCFSLGLAGLLLGTCLTAKILGMDAPRLSDRLSPLMCLCMAATRLSQRWLGVTGIGPVMPDGFPFVLMNEWGEPLLALFLAETLAALLGAAAACLPRVMGRKTAPGTDTARGLSFLLIPQIFFERLRTGQSMRWGMIRVEQLLCAVFALLVLLYLCRKLQSSGLRPLTVWQTMGLFSVLTGGIVWLEFVLDGKAAELPERVSWLLYGVTVLLMLAVSLINCHRLDKTVRKGRS